MKDIITNLKFLSNLQKNDKINTRYMFKESPGFLTSLSRTFFYNDNRKNALKFIENTINNGFELLSYYERLDKLSDKAICTNIVQDILQSKNGLENLKETYASDLQFVCNIDTIIQTIDAKMKDVANKYSEIIDSKTPTLKPLFETNLGQTNSNKTVVSVSDISPPYYSLSETEIDAKSPLNKITLPPVNTLKNNDNQETTVNFRNGSFDSVTTTQSTILPILGSTGMFIKSGGDCDVDALNGTGSGGSITKMIKEKMKNEKKSK